jgi:1-acyl-sn-glycerol-3-phosphate acyltransferase
MGAWFMVLCALFLFLRSELVLRIDAALGPERAMQRVTRYQMPISRKLFSMARLFGGLRTEFERYKGSLPAVFLVVSNHQSLADIPALILSFPNRDLRFVAKKELARGVPYISAALRLGRHALISRTGDFRQGHKELQRFGALTQRGISPAVFPEGTRSRTGKVSFFFTGAFRVVLEHTPVPVLSVAVDGGYRISTIPQLLNNMRGTLYRVKPLTLYPAPRGKKEISDLLGRIQAEITEQVRQWREMDAGRCVPRARSNKKPIL